LRCYGGSGKFDDKRIGRVLKDFVYIGSGKVKNPANKYSVITKVKSFNTVHANGSQIMAGKIEDLDKASERIAELEKELAKVNSEKTSKIEDQAKTLTDQNTVLSKQIEIEQKSNASLSDQIKNLKASIEKYEVKINEQKEELDKIKSESKMKSRLASMLQLDIPVKEDEHSKISSMSDDAFATMIEYVQKRSLVNKQDTSTESNAENIIETKEIAKSEVIPSTGNETVLSAADRVKDIISSAYAKTSKNKNDKK